MSFSIFQSFSVRKINAQSASLRSLVAAESTLQQLMQPARDYPLFCVDFQCIYLLNTGIKVFLDFLGFDLDPLTFRGHYH